MAESGLSPEFRAALDEVLAALARSLGRAPFEVQRDPAAHKVRLRGDLLQVPVRYELHWRRFRVLPTELVRDAAYLAMKSAKGRADEADCEAFAEAFLRDHVLSPE